MTNQTQLPLEDQIRTAVQSVEPNREFSNDLWNQIASRARQPKPRSLFQKLFPTPAWSAATVLIAVALIIAVVVLVAYGAYKLLGQNIASVVTDIAGRI